MRYAPWLYLKIIPSSARIVSLGAAMNSATLTGSNGLRVIVYSFSNVYSQQQL
jgi:hypothetical protein